MIKILFLYDNTNLLALTPIIEGLRNQGYQITLLDVRGLYSSHTRDLTKMAVDKANELASVGFDFGITCCHCGNPSIITLQKLLPIKYGYFDIEHDLYTAVIEKSLKEVSIGTFSFTKIATDYLTKASYKYYEAEWYKLDHLPYIKEYKEESLQNALIIDSIEVRNKYDSFQYKHLFNEVFIKNVDPGDSYEGFKSYPEWGNTMGITKAIDKAFFVLSCESSSIIESLYMDRIPILWHTSYEDEVEINDIISEVQIVENNVDRFHVFDKKLKFITCNNLEYKLDKLRNSPELRRECIDIMKKDWAFDNKKPTVLSILISEISRIYTSNI